VEAGRGDHGLQARVGIMNNIGITADGPAAFRAAPITATGWRYRLATLAPRANGISAQHLHERFSLGARPRRRSWKRDDRRHDRGVSGFSHAWNDESPALTWPIDPIRESPTSCQRDRAPRSALLP
jgi:hypothetical protein